jgi:putative transposase
MNDLSFLLNLLCTHLDRTTGKQLSIIVEAMFTMTGRITMLGISRWSEKGGSYRTIQRFFNRNIPWLTLNWVLFQSILVKNRGVILIAGDATVVTKSGKSTHALGKFYSSIYSRSVPAISFQCLSLICVNTRKSWPIMMEQMTPKAKKSNVITTKISPKRGKGRPKGSKNKIASDLVLNAEMTQVQGMLKTVISTISSRIKVTYFVYDGAFGNYAAAQMTHDVGLHLISKLRFDSALYMPYKGEYPGKGAPKKYGDRLDFQAIPEEFLCATEQEKEVTTKIYQIELLHKNFKEPLNVVILCKENKKTGKKGQVILFSTDLTLECDKIIEYYRLRFQIEFNFRDAKQHWGLEDFMVTQQDKVNNSAQISMFMVNVSQAMMGSQQEASIIDLKARFHGLRYVREVLKILQENGEDIKISPLLEEVSLLGRVHQRKDLPLAA